MYVCVCISDDFQPRALAAVNIKVNVSFQIRVLGKIMSLLFNMLCRFTFHLTDFSFSLNETEHGRYPGHA